MASKRHASSGSIDAGNHDSATAGISTAGVSAPASSSAQFHHPYTPYDVQMQFMKTVYDVCARGNGHVGILESPTGTGKSLSLICGALTWLRQHKRQQFAEAVNRSPDTFADEPDWVVEQMLAQKRRELAGRWARREERLREARRREARQTKRVGETTSKTKRQRVVDKMEEDEFLLDDEDDNDTAGGNGDSDDRLAWLSAETRARLEAAGLASSKQQQQGDEEEEEFDDNITIYYASRTHSQLTQFIAELRRPRFPASVPGGVVGGDDTNDDTDDTTEVVKHIPLSSRQRLCINPRVNRLGSAAAINDRCAELQKPSKKKDREKDGKEKNGGCPFVLTPANKPQTQQFRDTALATVPDIEDLYRLGTTLQVCPYYASRTAIAAAAGVEVVSLPYPLLLQREAREALGIRLDARRSIVIIDEAHNVMDAVASVHAAAVRLTELRRARALLGVYVKRFGRRLGQRSRLMVGQLGIVVASLVQWAAEQKETSAGIVDASALLRHKGADQVNLFALTKWVHEAKLAYKVEAYAAQVEEEPDGRGGGQNDSPASPVLHTLSSFLLALTNLASEGRIFYEKMDSDNDLRLSYLLLSPTHAFASIASSARAVILAGGTMSPMADYTTHLFPGLPADKLTTLSCGHVIPASNLCVTTLATMRPGANAPVFDFSFSARSTDTNLVANLGVALLNLCSVVPDGVVVFFPSYAYVDEVVGKWTASGTWAKLATKKKVFRESKETSAESVLAEYAAAVQADQGALLLSVVGGKMSEGINFADRLGRCVVVVGLPFANLHAPEWKARMEYVAEAAAATTGGQGTPPQDAPREYYENACMRAVNQSIGRAIRHQHDYAAIVLLDRRYASPRIRAKLPAWIRAGMSSERQDLGGVMTAVGSFFRGKS